LNYKIIIISSSLIILIINSFSISDVTINNSILLPTEQNYNKSLLENDLNVHLKNKGYEDISKISYFLKNNSNINFVYNEYLKYFEKEEVLDYISKRIMYKNHINLNDYSTIISIAQRKNIYLDKEDIKKYEKLHSIISNNC
jgi:hypothetical protein